MSHRTVHAIGPAEMVAGFALAGVPTIEAASDEQGAVRLAELLARDDVGIVLADDRLVQQLPLAVRQRAALRAVPVLVPVPRPSWKAEEAEPNRYILELLQRAIGYRVRLQ